MSSYNDPNNYGDTGRQTAAQFRANMMTMIDGLLAHGSAVMTKTPPTASDSNQNRAIQLYAIEARRLAAEYGLFVCVNSLTGFEIEHDRPFYRLRRHHLAPMRRRGHSGLSYRIRQAAPECLRYLEDCSMRKNWLLAAAATLLIAVLPAQADQSPGAARIVSGTDKPDLPGGPTLGTYQNGQFTLQPYAIQIGAGGTTGPVDGGTVSFPSLATRTLLDRLSERPSVVDYGVDMTGAANSTAALTAALNSGKRVTAPCGTIRLVSTVAVTAQADFQGSGACTRIKYDAPAGVAVTPLLDIQKTASGTRLDNFAVDHQANTKGFARSTVYGGDILASSAVLVQADDTSLTRITASNGFDNCIAIAQYAGAGATVNAGFPRRVSVRGARTNGCGVGSSPKAGAGIDVGSGSLTVVDDLVDIGSYGAFILDLGAGAQGSFSNLQGFFNKYDPAGKGNYSFYIGAPGSQFSNLHSFKAGYRGLWVDGFATDTTIANVMIKGPAAEGVILMASRTSIANMAVNSPGLGKKPGTVDAITIPNGTRSLTDINITGLVVSSDFNTARYGISKNGTGTVSGSVVGSSFTGAASGAVAPDVDPTFAVLDATALLGPWTTYMPAVTTSRGAFATVSATGKYRRVGKSVFVSITVSLGDKGTATDVKASIPFAAKGVSPLSGAEIALTGRGMAGVIFNGQSTVLIKNTDGTNPLTNGYVLTVGGEYEAP
ncbi:hypothetical protein [Methylobacterium oryzae]|uniref:Uncharacterized protein n=1 Tax=Methylobacterium oryzae TaxID=334852 RepID=A0ABU7TTP9_9HYPH